MYSLKSGIRGSAVKYISWQLYQMVCVFRTEVWLTLDGMCGCLGDIIWFTKIVAQRFGIH